MSVEAPSATKRCPRCETEKHRREFLANGYCRPCSASYSRERYHASKGSNPPPPRAAKPAPPPNPPAAGDVTAPTIPSGAPTKPTTISDVADRVRSRGTKPPERDTEPPAAGTITPSRETRPVVPFIKLGAVARVAGQLVDVIEDGQTMRITVSRYGAVIVLGDIEIGAAP